MFQFFSNLKAIYFLDAARLISYRQHAFRDFISVLLIDHSFRSTFVILMPLDEMCPLELKESF